eukprot:473198-Pyramimonas_sp.AAC.2
MTIAVFLMFLLFLLLLLLLLLFRPPPPPPPPRPHVPHPYIPTRTSVPRAQGRGGVKRNAAVSPSTPIGQHFLQEGGVKSCTTVERLSYFGHGPIQPLIGVAPIPSRIPVLDQVVYKGVDQDVVLEH